MDEEKKQRVGWDQRLFLSINKRVGKNKWLDTFMIFCAQRLIFVMVGILGVVAVGADLLLLNQNLYGGIFSVTRMLALFVGAPVVFGVLLSWCIGCVVRRKRPKVRYPHIVTLITPYSNWKSFPSDHTLIASIICLPVFLLVLTGSIFWLLIFIVYALSAFLVAISRVYVGVHYPGDIIGGFILAILTMYLFIFSPLTRILSIG